MKQLFLSSYPKFSCIGGACPDTCCRDWCVVVDEKTEAYYRTLPGELGSRVRAHLTRDEEGETCLSFEGTFCPMLTEQGLCSLQASLGEEALCAVCGRYPRFRYEYGGLAQLGVSISCPEACRQVLEMPLRMESGADDLPPSLNDIDPQCYFTFRKGLDQAMALVTDSTYTLGEKLSALLRYAEKLEPEPDDGALMSRCLAQPAEDALLQKYKPADFESLRDIFAKMEYLREQDREAVQSCAAPAPFADETAGTRLLGYYVFKYFLQAAYDGKLLKKVQFAVASVLMIGALAAGNPDKARLTELASRFSRETEHSEENLNAFYRRAGRRQQAKLMRLIRKICP